MQANVFSLQQSSKVVSFLVFTFKTETFSWVAPNIMQYLQKVIFFPFAGFVSWLPVFYLLSLVLSVSPLAVLLWAMSIIPLSACPLPAYYSLNVIAQHTTSQHNLPINRRSMSHTWLSLPQLFSPLRKIQVLGTATNRCPTSSWNLLLIFFVIQS